MRWLWWGLAGLGLVLVVAPTNMALPRGIRNNNPGNIRRTSTPWQGLAEKQTDPAYLQFAHPKWGIRAMVRILRTYRDAYGLTTVRQIITRWAPASENETDAYVQDVAGRLGVNPDEPIDIEARMPELVAAIIRHENGMQPYDVATIHQAIQLAGIA